jgi:hypothetical protein
VRTCECGRARSLASSDSVCVLSTCVRGCNNNKATHVPSTTVQQKAVPTHSLVGGTVVVVIVIETVAAALGDVVERFDQT